MLRRSRFCILLAGWSLAFHFVDVASRTEGDDTLADETAAGAPASETTLEKTALAGLRGLTTNVQFHKDGSVRLVRLSKPIVTNQHLVHLRHFLKLDYLAIICPEVTDEGVANIAELAELDTLLLSQTGITDHALSHLTRLAKLRRLYLGQSNITDAGTEHLIGLQSLEVFSAPKTGLSSSGLAPISNLGNLTTLLLSDTRVSDDGLEHVSRLSHLKILYLANCPIRGSGAKHLESLSELEHLCLNGTDIDDQAVAALGKLTQLKHLELYETRLTAGGVSQLRHLLPKTRLHLDPAIVRVVDPRAGDAEDLAAGLPAAGPANVESTEVLLPILQRLDGDQAPPDFQRHVVPLLGRLGCNGRACHGSFQGQGGFRLSMFGYDFDMDLKNLRERIDLEQPESSLILNKPTSADEHEGGLRLPPGQWQQELLRRWIQAGSHGLPEKPAEFVRLEVTPAEMVFQDPGQTVQLQAIAVWSDGSREDVTCLTRFETQDDGVAEVSADGIVKATGKGDTYVISFYDNGIFSTQVVVPVSQQVGDRYPRVATPTKIDELVVAKLRKLGIAPSALCSDETFLRRVSIDLIGTLPTPQEIVAFLADSSSDKRSRKIEELLERPAYVTWWTTRLCDLTGSNAGYLGGTEMAQPVATQWRAWIERRVRDNVGWDEIASGIILARSRRDGQPYADFIIDQSEFTRRKDPADFAAAGNPMPHFWFRSNLAQPTEKALAFGYTFLGLRLDCAQCHKHPYDQWSKQDFELFTEFFTRIKAGYAPDAAALHEHERNRLGVPVKLNTAALRRQSYLRVAAEGQRIPWKEIYVEAPGDKPQPARLLGGAHLDLSQYRDPREPLMQWLRGEPNRYFAKAFVNRVWANYFNIGIIDPPDDLNQANPPSNKALLEYLAQGFIDNGYDMKWLHRAIATSRTYQLDWRPNDTNRTDQRNFSHAVLRRLPAEVAVDGLIQATGNDKVLDQVATRVDQRKIGQHPKSFQTRAIDFSLLIFGKPLRTTNCDCERQGEPTLLQALYVRNDQELLAMLDRKDGWLAQVAAGKLAELPVDDLVQSAYLRTLSRRPNESELTDCRNHFAEQEDRAAALRDLLWALLNTQEFITNH